MDDGETPQEETGGTAFRSLREEMIMELIRLRRILHGGEIGDGSGDEFSSLRDEMVSELGRLRELMDPWGKIVENMGPEEKEILERFLLTFKICPLCGYNNSDSNLKDFYFSEMPEKRELRDGILDLMDHGPFHIENGALVNDFTCVTIGVPCCSCFDKIFMNYPEIDDASEDDESLFRNDFHVPASACSFMHDTPQFYLGPVILIDKASSSNNMLLLDLEPASEFETISPEPVDHKAVLERWSDVVACLQTMAFGDDLHHLEVDFTLPGCCSKSFYVDSDEHWYYLLVCLGRCHGETRSAIFEFLDSLIADFRTFKVLESPRLITEQEKPIHLNFLRARAQFIKERVVH